ncbi:MAG: enoyl-CoA hydratase/isomerase family protein [Alphaproteobacteria bacterium]|nr:enoyl-CoA hydratase/isomerase family protein [Alphaproteobacteria bacterium]
MNQDISEEVLIERKGPLGVITLNRPAALNALTLEMIRQVSDALRMWQKDNGIISVLFLGAGERAFSAGGDLKALYRVGMDYRRGNVDSRLPAIFFAEEYCLNRQIFHYPKPTIAFMDGITMGGGFGIGGNCKHRIVTEKTVMAMPEVGIGFFPDVGSVFHLLRSPRHFGRYMALTGISVGPGDVLEARLAEYFVPAAQRKKLLRALENVSKAQGVEQAIRDIAQKNPPSVEFSAHGEKTEKIFDSLEVQKILGALARDGSAWAEEVLDTMRKRSPASIVVTAEHLRRSAGKSFDDVIREDFILVQRFAQRMDLYEGIRAVIVDKDNKPKWDPPDFDAMDSAYAQGYFNPTGYNLDDVKIFAA